MHRFFVGLVLAALAGVSVAPVQAQPATYPWCARYETKLGGNEDCTFSSFRQCMDLVLGGMGGWCQANPSYAERVAAGRGKKKKKKTRTY
jgi:hypothetical protein